MFILCTAFVASMFASLLNASHDQPSSQTATDRIAFIASEGCKRINQDIIEQYIAPEWPESILKKQDHNPELLSLLIARLGQYTDQINKYTLDIHAALIPDDLLYSELNYTLLQKILVVGAALYRKMTLTQPEHHEYGLLEDAFGFFFLALADCPACPPNMLDFTPALVILNNTSLTPVTPFVSSQKPVGPEDLYLSEPESDGGSTNSSTPSDTSEPHTPSYRPSEAPDCTPPLTNQRFVLPEAAADRHPQD